jgi:transposase-like protein
MLSTEEKQMIVRECHYLTTHQVSKKYGISVNNICRWRKRCERKTGAGRKVHDPRMEIDLLKWISQVGKKSPLTRQLIRKKAIELSEDDNFKASKGWFERFMNRNRELIRKSGYGTKLPSTQKSVKVARQPEE